MIYSESVENIPSSPIRDMMMRAAKLPDVLSFSLGEPDFTPPPEAIEAGKKSLELGESFYAPGAGFDELRSLYASYLSEQDKVPYEKSNVIVTTGGMSCLFLALLCMVNPGDEVLISAPYFSNYNQMVKMCYGIPVSVDVYEKNDFILDAEAVRKSITPRSKVLMINSPCNPTGGVLSKEALKELADLAKEHNLMIISDEVYRHILFDNEKYYSIVQFPGMQERTLIVDSCSKTFAMTGFRVGFGAGPEHLINLMTKMTEGIYSSTSIVGQRAAIEALKTGLPYCKKMVAEYQKRRDYLYQKLNSIPGISCIKPKGAFYVFANIEGTGLSANDFCHKLLEEKHVAVVPGGNFGSKDGNKFIRFSYAYSMEKIIQGCSRIEEFCISLKK